MQSKYVEAEAARAVAERAPTVSEALALRTYTARLLGSEPRLVLHGGGNTSVKAEATTALGETVQVLHIKGSGWDLATIEPPGHPAVRLSQVQRLLALPTMTDETMVNELRLALLDAAAPTPSVETLLHAALPARYIDHTHANAILAVADQDDGERVCREIFRDRLLWVPYVMPGFGLARACKDAWDAAARAGQRPTVMILERHGVFTFGDTAKESYERMIDAVTLAERYAADKMATANVPAIERNAELEAIVLPVVRGALASVRNQPLEQAPIVVIRSNEWIIHFLERPDVAELTRRGCATPDHVIRTKPWPLVLASPDYDDVPRLEEQLRRAIQDFARDYDRYFEETCARKGTAKTKLDPWPRILLLPKIGIVACGETKKDAEIAADIYENTISIITDAEDVGRYSPVSHDDLFDVEYWSLEQAKIKKTSAPPLGQRVAVVTGAASGIGKATARRFLELGAHVVLCDKNETALQSAAEELQKKFGPRVIARAADVTQRFDVDAVFRLAARTFGGVDIVVSNAGNAPEGRLDTDEGDAELRASLEMNLLSHNVVAASAAEIMLLSGRGGCLLFNASKSAFNQGPGFGPYAVAKAGLVALVRQYAVDLGKYFVRSNAVNADRIRTGIFGGGVLESRAAARGLSVDDYFRSNLLRREVTAEDVADAFAWLATASSTTGCVVTVDGGNAAAFPR